MTKTDRENYEPLPPEVYYQYSFSFVFNDSVLFILFENFGEDK